MGGTVLTLLSRLATTHSTAAAIIRYAGLSGMTMISSPTTLTVPGKALARSRLIRILRSAGPSRATSCHLHSLTPLRPKRLTLLHATPTGRLTFIEAHLLERCYVSSEICRPRTSPARRQTVYARIRRSLCSNQGSSEKLKGETGEHKQTTNADAGWTSASPRVSLDGHIHRGADRHSRWSQADCSRHLVSRRGNFRQGSLQQHLDRDERLSHRG